MDIKQYSYLRVEKHGRRKVFRHGTLLFDLLPADMFYSGRPDYSEVTLEISLQRNGEEYDRGRLTLVGTHGESLMFVGFERATRRRYRNTYGSSIVTHVLLPQAFAVGDVFRIPIPASRLRAKLIAEWRGNYGYYSPAMKKRREAADARVCELSLAFCERFKARHGVSVDDILDGKCAEPDGVNKEDLRWRAYNGAEKKGFKDFDRYLQNLPLPRVLRLRKYSQD